MANKAWSGPPLLESITGKPVEVSLIPNIKKKKGKKKEAALPPALERIMGYAGSDMSEDEVRVRAARTSCASATAAMGGCTERGGCTRVCVGLAAVLVCRW